MIKNTIHIKLQFTIWLQAWRATLLYETQNQYPIDKRYSSQTVKFYRIITSMTRPKGFLKVSIATLS